MHTACTEHASGGVDESATHTVRAPPAPAATGGDGNRSRRERDASSSEGRELVLDTPALPRMYSMLLAQGKRMSSVGVTYFRVTS